MQRDGTNSLPGQVWWESFYDGIPLGSGWKPGVEEAVKTAVDGFHLLAGRGAIDVSSERALDRSVQFWVKIGAQG